MAKPPKAAPPPPPPPPNEPKIQPAPRESITVELKESMPLGNGTRPAGFLLGVIMPAPGVTLHEWQNAFLNPERLSYRGA